MQKTLGWIVAIAVATAAVVLGGRAYASRAMSSRAVTPKPLGATTPTHVDLPFARITIESGDRTLIGWWVRARADSGKVAPALLFMHGNRSAISDYVALQKFFYRQGVSTLVFDYSGFGASSGAASLQNAIGDAGAAARVFADSAGKDARKIAMGSALGSTVLLQAIDSVQPHVNGIVIEGVDASVRESAVRSKRLPKVLAGLVAEPGDNVAAAARVDVPVLAVQSYADQRTPIADAEKVVAAVPGRSSLVRHWRKGHSAILTSTRPCDWAPVLSFVRSGNLPAAKLDTTDACKVEAAQMLARADSLKAAAAKTAAMKRPATSPVGAGTKAAGTAAAGAKTTSIKTGTTKTPATKSPPASSKTKSTTTGTKTRAPAPATKRPSR